MRETARGSWGRRGRQAGLLLLALGVGRPGGVAWAWAGPGSAAGPGAGPGPGPGPGRAAALAQALARGPLTLAQVVALALENNPEARAAVAQAQAASAALGSARGRYYPSLSFDPTLTRTQGLVGASRSGTVAGAPLTTQRTALTPSLTLSYLLLDFGGRGGTVDEARQVAAAANGTSDATVQSTVLQAEGAYFSYNAARDLLAAERENVRTATESSAAAADRYHVGLATVADTLQAATALAQAQLALLTAQGELQTARGNLAAAIGASAETPFEIAQPAGLAPVRSVAADVDSLIQRALRERPDLEAAHATAAAARDEVRIAHAAALPSVSLSGNAGRALADTPGLSGNTYALTVGLQLPLFSGFSRHYDIKAAAARAEAADARTDATRVQVANQVFTSYANLQVATARVQASAQALASATQSEDVARGRYREGVGSFIDLIVAQNALAAARGQAAGARWGWYTSLAQLAHDAGTLDRTGDARLPMSADTSATPGKTE